MNKIQIIGVWVCFLGSACMELEGSEEVHADSSSQSEATFIHFEAYDEWPEFFDVASSGGIQQFPVTFHNKVAPFPLDSHIKSVFFQVASGVEVSFVGITGPKLGGCIGQGESIEACSSWDKRKPLPIDSAYSGQVESDETSDGAGGGLRIQWTYKTEGKHLASFAFRNEQPNDQLLKLNFEQSMYRENTNGFVVVTPGRTSERVMSEEKENTPYIPADFHVGR